MCSGPALHKAHAGHDHLSDWFRLTIVVYHLKGIGTKMKLGKFESTANVDAAKWLSNLIVVIVALAVSGLGDVMYLQLMNSKFPTGLLLIFCYVGAFSSFLGMIYLLVGKMSFFAPGKQTWAAWLMLGVEMIVAGLNISLVFFGVQHATGLLAVWYNLSPATPLIIMAFILLVFFVDPAFAEKHLQQEMELEKRKMDMAYEIASHQAHHQVRTGYLAQISTRLEQELASPHVQAQIKQHAAMMVARVLSDATGLPVMPSNIVVPDESSTHVQLAQTASSPALSLPSTQSQSQAQAQAPVRPLSDTQPLARADVTGLVSALRSIWTAQETMQAQAEQEQEQEQAEQSPK